MSFHIVKVKVLITFNMNNISDFSLKIIMIDNFG